MKTSRFILLIPNLVFLFLLISCSGISKTAKTNQTIKFLSYNVRNCKGMDNITNYQRLADAINKAGAACVALQELDSNTLRSNHCSVLDELAKRTNMFPFFHGSISYQGGKYGIGILTKEKPVSVRAFTLPGSEEKRSILIAEMKNYFFCCTHLSLTPEDRAVSIDIINRKLPANSKKPVILAGDLNAEPQTAEIGKLTENWQILSDTTRYTFPADKPDRCIDYFLFKKDPKFRAQIIGTCVMDEPLASDHRPLLVEIIFLRN
ncbi:MAG TPA: endonuclease/exonuclease/phosphatase family protein [Paludibacteraceae bacterium]|nr:endonuclease/exonuclease/phosphatase family protein [Paludibacteraceae bacterium]HPT43773.1 endonuclease/exonuclease/phosphatase family protein [Paludibacteraceae bacterium]